MFDQKTNLPDNAELTPLEPQNFLAADLPKSSQSQVMPKFNSTSIGAQDMFAETEDNESIPSSAAPVFENISQISSMPSVSPVGPTEPLSELPDDLDSEPGGKKKYIWLGAIVLAIIILGGGYFAYSKFLAGGVNAPGFNLNISPSDFNKRLQEEVINLNLNQSNPDNTDVEGLINENLNINNENTNQEVNVNFNNNVNSGINENVFLDSDKDGLTDAEEASLGTDADSTDTDGDGLFDYEEVKTYHTDPLNPDTDGDGYLDGEEVQGGYNPNGPGKLLEANFNSQ